MKIGLVLSPEYPATDDPVRRFAEHREQVRLARDAGFDVIAIPHHYSRGPSQWFPPLLMAAALAGELGHMRLATTVFLLPLQHPVEVAEQVALLDVLSDGRFTFGVGAGWQREEFRALGIPREERATRFEEALDVIERLWSGESTTFHGRHFVLDDVRLTLRPVQRPRPPLWIGANASPAAIRRAARRADAWIVSAHPDLDTVEQQLDVYRSALDEYRRPFPDELPVLRNVYVGSDMESALTEAWPYFAASYDVFGHWGLFDDARRTGRGPSPEDALTGGRLIVGGPRDCLEQILACRERIPIGCLLLCMQWLGLPQGNVRRAIARFGEHILPALRSAAPPADAGFKTSTVPFIDRPDGPGQNLR